VKLRNENEINDAVLRKLELELDLLDIRYQGFKRYQVRRNRLT